MSNDILDKIVQELEGVLKMERNKELLLEEFAYSVAHICYYNSYVLSIRHKDKYNYSSISLNYGILIDCLLGIRRETEKYFSYEVKKEYLEKVYSLAYFILHDLGFNFKKLNRLCWDYANEYSGIPFPYVEFMKKDISHAKYPIFPKLTIYISESNKLKKEIRESLNPLDKDKYRIFFHPENNKHPNKYINIAKTIYRTITKINNSKKVFLFTNSFSLIEKIFNTLKERGVTIHKAIKIYRCFGDTKEIKKYFSSVKLNDELELPDSDTLTFEGIIQNNKKVFINTRDTFIATGLKKSYLKEIEFVNIGGNYTIDFRKIDL